MKRANKNLDERDPVPLSDGLMADADAQSADIGSRGESAPIEPGEGETA